MQKLPLTTTSHYFGVENDDAKRISEFFKENFSKIFNCPEGFNWGESWEMTIYPTNSRGWAIEVKTINK